MSTCTRHARTAPAANTVATAGPGQHTQAGPAPELLQQQGKHGRLMPRLLLLLAGRAGLVVAASCCACSTPSGRPACL